MGTIGDRTWEHLGTTDDFIIHLRRLLLKDARGLQKGKPPPFQDEGIDFNQICSEEIIIAADERSTYAGEGEMIRSYTSYGSLLVVFM